MLMLDEPSRAWATVATREPVPTRIQNVVRLSESDDERSLTSYAYCVSSVAIRRPNPPVWAAPATTVLVPVPCEVFQLPSEPDSKPSEKIVSVYCDRAARGVSGGVCGVDGPWPTALTAATVKVYGTPLVSPATVYVVPVEPVAIGACAVPPTYGVTM